MNAPDDHYKFPINACYLPFLLGDSAEGLEPHELRAIKELRDEALAVPIAAGYFTAQWTDTGERDAFARCAIDGTHGDVATVHLEVWR